MLVAGAALEVLSFRRGLRRARELSAAGRRFERRLAAGTITVLVLGDSTGVGVGARLPEESIAGLLASDFPGADIVNIAESGARVARAVLQAKACVEAGLRFDIALLHVGANDIVVDTPLDVLAQDCDLLLQELGRLTRRTVWLGPPDLSLAPLFPPPYSWLMGARSRAAIRVFARVAARRDVAFVDFSAPAHSLHFRQGRRAHFAADGFHPNSDSYRYGYAVARSMLGLDPVPV